jgi:hypothetical protein
MRWSGHCGNDYTKAARGKLTPAGDSNENGPVTEYLSSGLLIGQFYPASTLGLYLKAGVGSRIFLNPGVDLVGHTCDTEFGNDRERLVHYGVGIAVEMGK